MDLSDGQKIALAQLERIAAVDGSALRIINVEDKEASDDALRIDIALDCSHYKRREGGLNLHATESVRLHVPVDFPFMIPSVTTAHTRFLGFPHVQWGQRLCLYLAPATQWMPSNGMYGLIEQLNNWLSKAAQNELDDPEGPLHPPVAYTTSFISIRVQANTPPREVWPWFGAGILNRNKSDLIDITGWQEVYQLEQGQVFAPAVLLDFELPFEYPRTVRQLLKYMERRGIETSRVLAHLMIASERLAERDSLYVIIGAPSRGVTGDKVNRRQHLTVWEIKSEDVVKLRKASAACHVSQLFLGQETPAEIKSILEPVFDNLFKWQNQSPVQWCEVFENRPEIVTRRDSGTPMDWFKEKRVALWGCGALGSLVAEHLVRTGVKSLKLYDNQRVTPGILVRQNYTEGDIKAHKSDALKNRLTAIAPHIDVTAHTVNLITDTLQQPDWDQDVDVIIDATASLHVRSKLEAILKGQQRTLPIAAMMISGRAQHAAMVLSPIGYSGGPLDVFRRLGLSAMNHSWLKPWVRAFWSSETDEPIRQPEPGCSDPTFVASHADIAGLASRMLNSLAAELARGGDHATGCLFTNQTANGRDHSFRYRSDILVNDRGIEFRISASAWRDIRGWIRAGARIRSDKDETGGLLFGQYDEVLGVAWITCVSGPPKDSSFSVEGFICGTEGTQQLCADYQDRSHRVIQFLGTWHSHPVSPAKPSNTDYAGIAAIFAENPTHGVHQIMIIVGYASHSNAEIGVYLFEKCTLESRRNGICLDVSIQGNKILAPKVDSTGRSIGLALSGGGSRAVAFHLGTLRALEDLQLLDEVQVISGVSGGSLMTGLVGYTDARFKDIDANVVSFLRRGLVWPIFKKFFEPHRALQMFAAFLLAALPTLLMEFFVLMLRKLSAVLPGMAKINAMSTNWHWPVPRWYSRTHVMADAIADIVGRQYCDAPTRQKKAIVFNACELRTGTAFRMSNEKFGSWRFGYASAKDLRVANAIAASAAYPPFLPPLNWKLKLDREGQIHVSRLLVTDGGVFENLGVSVMEPGRDSRHSAIAYKPEIVIASDAGTGQYSGAKHPTSWPSRMVQATSAIMRKVQDATKQRLHKYAEDGDLERFVYASLGQVDERVFLKPANWVDRESVVDYPTDFSAMSDAAIARLSARGEAITRALVTQYLLSD